MKTIYTLLDGTKIDVNEIMEMTPIQEDGNWDLERWLNPCASFKYSIAFKNKRYMYRGSDHWDVSRRTSQPIVGVVKQRIEREFRKEYDELVSIWESL